MEISIKDLSSKFFTTMAFRRKDNYLKIASLTDLDATQVISNSIKYQLDEWKLKFVQLFGEEGKVIFNEKLGIFEVHDNKLYSKRLKKWNNSKSFYA